MKGYKDENGKFHPLQQYKKTRRKRSPSTLDGIKIIRKTKSNIVLKGVEKNLKDQPKSVRNKIHTIIIKDKDPDEDFVAKIDATNGEVIFNRKPELTEDDYEALGEHEFQHIDFNDHIQKGDPKYEEFVKMANTISPFTPDLMMTKEEQDQAFIDGNFGILPDKRLEYPDEINSVVKELETREMLGLPTNILNEEEYKKAKHLVEQLHKEVKIRKGRWDVKNDNERYWVQTTGVSIDVNDVERLRPIPAKTLGEAIRLIDEGKGNTIFDQDTGDVIKAGLKKRDIIIGKSSKPDSFFNKNQLEIGTKIELEHTNSPEIAKRIAKDHLEESPRYYTELVKLESRLESGK